jgi:hypothetical protein
VAGVVTGVGTSAGTGAAALGGDGPLVFAGGDVARETAPWPDAEVVHPFPGTAARPAGRTIRERASRSAADTVAVVTTPRCLADGWLAAAHEALGPGVGAVVLVDADTPLAGSPCPVGAATVFSGWALREVGGFFQAFDHAGTVLDALWRLTARGHGIAEVRGFVRRGVTVDPPDLGLLLALAVHNLEASSLGRLLPDVVLASVTGPLRAHGVDTTALDLRLAPGGDDVATLPVPDAALVGVRQVEAFCDSMERLRGSRRTAQSTRRLSDRALGPSVAAFLAACREAAGGGEDLLAAGLGAADQSLRTVVVSDSGLPGGRATALAAARALGQTGRVAWFDAGPDTWSDWTGADWADSPCGPPRGPGRPDLIVLGPVDRLIPWLAECEAPVILDATDWPSLAVEPDRVVRWALNRADRVLVRDAGQRDVVLGFLAGLDRFSPFVYEEDCSLANLVAVARHGLGPALAEWAPRARRAADAVTSLPQDPGVRPVRPLARWLRRFL